jgi:heme exporter protein B
MRSPVDEPGLGALLRASWAVFRKDLQIELRTRYALNALAMFVLTTVLVTSFYLGPGLLRRDPNVAATSSVLLWVTILFAALTGLARVFVGEEEAQTTTLLRLHAPGLAVFWGKWLLNTVLLQALMLVATVCFGILTGLRVGNPWLLLVALGTGGLGLSTATTLIAGIIAKASARSALFAALTIPVLFPLLLLVVQTTEQAILGQPMAAALGNIQSITAYVVALTAASVLLFPFVWEA